MTSTGSRDSHQVTLVSLLQQRRTWLRLALAGLAVLVLWPLIRWALVDAVFWPPTPEACRVVSAEGAESEPLRAACWPAVLDTLRLLLVGRYPAEDVWRLCAAAVCGGMALFSTLRRWPLWTTCLGLMAAALFVMGAPWLGLVTVPSSEWGGLALTMILSTVGLVGGGAVGMVLAVARSSALPVARWLAITYTEVLRGVPLITVLFFALYILPLFLPQDAERMSEVGRAAIAIVMFEAAYFAEVIRGGLAAVDPGQDEAARALGMSPFQRLRLVILPQALRAATPALISTSIGLIKDTSLVAIIGLFDLLGTARNVPSIPRWIGRDIEPLIFAGLVYLTLSLLLERMAARYGTNRQAASTMILGRSA